MKSISGGSVLFIESTFVNPVEALETSGKDEKNAAATTGSLTLTGKLGDVMKESCKIAHTYAKAYLQRIDPNNRALRLGHIHVHVPEVCDQNVHFLLRSHRLIFFPGRNTERWSFSWLHNRHRTVVVRLE